MSKDNTNRRIRILLKCNKIKQIKIRIYLNKFKILQNEVIGINAKLLIYKPQIYTNTYGISARDLRNSFVLMVGGMHRVHNCGAISAAWYSTLLYNVQLYWNSMVMYTLGIRRVMKHI